MCYFSLEGGNCWTLDTMVDRELFLLTFLLWIQDREKQKLNCSDHGNKWRETLETEHKLRASYSEPPGRMSGLLKGQLGPGEELPMATWDGQAKRDSGSLGG